MHGERIVKKKEIFQKCSLKRIDNVIIGGMSHYAAGQNYFKLIIACAFDKEKKLELLIQKITPWAKKQIVLNNGYLADYSRILARFGKNEQARKMALEITDDHLQFTALLYNAQTGKRREDFEFLLQELKKICPYGAEKARAKIAETLAKIGETKWAKQVAEEIKTDKIRQRVISNIDHYARKIIKEEKIKSSSGLQKISLMYNFENLGINSKTLDQAFEDAIKIKYGEMATDIVREYLASNNIGKARKAACEMINVRFAEFFASNAFLLVYLKSKDWEDLKKAFALAHECDDNFTFGPAALAELALVMENTVTFREACEAINKMPIFDNEQKLLEYIAKRMLKQIEPCSFEKFRTAGIGEV